MCVEWMEDSQFLCSSWNETDYLWCSKGVVVSAIVSADNVCQECEQCWSPGMVLCILPNTVSQPAFAEIVNRLAVFGKKLGKARRISIPADIKEEALITLLYQSFYCVEKVDAQGRAQLVR